MQYLTIQ